MDRHELAEAIRLPAEWYGLDVTDPLVEELSEAVYGKPGALPLLEFSLDQMWRALPPGKETLSLDEYRRIRGLDGALGAHADQVLNGLDGAEQALARKLFVNHLTTVDQPGIRRVIRRSDCDPAYWPVIVRMADARLLTVGCDENGRETAEVVHEALLQAWNQLHVWLDSEEPFRRWRQRLREDLRQWRETRDSAELLTGSQLAAAERWKNDRRADLDMDELRFIEASSRRRDEQDDYNLTLTRRARARELTHLAESAQDPNQALRYAIEVIEFSPDPPVGRLVRACLHRLGTGELEPVTRQEALRAADRFGQRLTVAEWSRSPWPDRKWRLGEPDWGLVIGVLIACVAVSDTAHLVMAACIDDTGGTTIRVLDGSSLAEVAALPFDGFVRDADVSTGHWVAALGHDRRLRVWDLVTRDVLCESVQGLGVSRIAFDQDYVMAGEAGPVPSAGSRSTWTASRSWRGRRLTAGRPPTGWLTRLADRQRSGAAGTASAVPSAPGHQVPSRGIPAGGRCQG